ncbi:MAG: SusC/RagA family TonB-linked outer membrane protein [Bacteroides sp.]
MNFNRFKVIFFIFFINSFLCVSLFAQSNARITIKKKNTTLQEALQEIEKQSTYLVAFNESKLEKAQRIDLNINAEPLEKALSMVLSGTGLSYKIKDRHIMIVPESKPVAQQRRVTGTVKDGNGEPLIGVNVKVKGAGAGTITNLNGEFFLQAAKGEVLEISYIGYAPKQITLGDALAYSVVLQEDAKVLDEVVVTALGLKRSEKALSYNVQQLANDELTRVKDVNFVNSLSGKVAGVTINRSASGVGGSTRVVMRGTKSLAGDNNVLYVIDGIPLSNPTQGRDVGQFSAPAGGEGISDFNNEDIESISVLTGPSAAALYGASAANGVVLINTKRGKEGKTSVSISNNTEFLSPFITPKFQNRYGNAVGQFRSWGDKLETPSSYDPLSFLRTGTNVMNAANLSVGNKTNQTFLSLATTNSAGIVPNNKYYRYNFSVRNTATLLNDKLHLDLGASFVLQGDQNMTSQGMYHNPLLPLYLFPRGEDFEQVKMYERYDPVRNFPVQYWPYGEQGINMENPYWIVNREMFFTNKKRYMLHANIKYDILDWLNVTGRVRVDNTYTDQEKKLYASTLQLFTNSPNGSFAKNRIEYNQTYVDMMVNVNKTFGDISLTATLGASSDDYYTTGVGVGGRLFRVPNLFSAANLYPDSPGASESYARTRNLAIFGSAEIGYKNMAYLTLTGRNDWASQNVGSKEPSIFYPSVGLSFLLSEMFKMPEPISFVKVRASYTKVGSPISKTGITPGSITYPISGGIVSPISTYPFPNFKAEQTKSYEVGANIRLFQNKINIDATWYQSNTYNQLFESALPPSTGYSSFYLQAGNIRNRGVELSVGYNDNFGKLAYATNVTYTMNRNKIIEMVRDYENPIDKSRFDIKDLTVNGHYLREGDSMQDLYTVGILQRDRDNNLIPEADGFKVDKTQKIKIGSSDPKYSLGWKNSLRYSGFDLSVLISARVGGIVTSTTQAYLDDYGVSVESANARDAGGVWVGGKQYDAKAYYGTVGGQKLGAYYSYSATNIRLQELALSYTLPRKLFKNVIEGITFSFTGRNLWMIYKKAPYDPEVLGSTGTYANGDFFMFPSLRSFGFGVKIQL